MAKKLNVVGGVVETAYYRNDMHRLLAEDAWKAEGPNIGKAGENLTIAFLSLQRTTLSLRLVQSLIEHLPSFKGELLIVDNGSDEHSRKELGQAIKATPFRSRLVSLGRNYGVSGGRNRGTRHVKTDWVMWLDNDIYLIGNPIARIQSDIAVLGCHFLSLPLLQPDLETLFANGGHLYVDFYRGDLRVGAGSVARQERKNSGEGEGFLSTFLFGGACVANVLSFTQMGGYDEQAFIGFEDIDFSLRLFRAGMKVGTTGALDFVHDHSVPDTVEDIAYEDERFSIDTIKSSADHFENKYGLRFWSSSTEDWLLERRSTLGLTNVVPPPDNSGVLGLEGGKPKIGLIVDRDDWAFFNIASQLVRLLSDRFEFSLVSMESLSHNVIKALWMCDDCDLVHFFWRDDLSQLYSSRCRRYAFANGIDLEQFMDRYFRSKPVTTAVFDHLYLEPDKIELKRTIFRDYTTAYSVCSKRLDAIYRSIAGYPAPSGLLPDGVDLRLFQPMRLARLEKPATKNLVVGWAGNSAWHEASEDPKGLNTILLPALRALADEGKSVQWKFADRATTPVPFYQMPEYYGSIDVLVCSSKIEGTPNPVLEAMACGVPVISTDVGIVPEAFGPLQREFILAERSVAKMKSAISDLIDRRGALRRLSEENLESIKDWDWSIQAAKYGTFFSDALARFAGVGKSRNIA